MTVNNIKEKETPQRERGKLLFNALPDLFRHPLFNLSMVRSDLFKIIQTALLRSQARYKL